MKRVLALILAMASMITLLNCTPIYAEDAVTLTEDQKAVLSYVGIYDEEADLTETVTKAEFATMLSKVAFGLDANLEALASGDGAKDVPLSTDYYTAITALLSSGHISTNKFGNFLPEQKIDVETAYEFLLRTMGYSKTDLFIQGKYSKLLAQKDVTDGLYSMKGNGVSRVNAYILIYNMLNADITDMLSLEYNISSNKQVLFREARLDLFKATGIVTDDGVTSINGETAVNSDEIVIAYGEVMFNKTGLGNLVGKNVVAYYTDGDYQHSVVFLYERVDKNQVVVIEGINIIKFDTTKATVNEYVYYDDEFSSKQQKTKVKKNATIVYNDKALKLTEEFTPDMFIPETGVVRLYDNSGDGIMDVIRIEDYRAVVVTGKDIATNSVFLKANGETLNLDTITHKIYDADGREKDFSAITGGMVLSLMESLDGERIKILMSSEMQSGTVNSCAPSTDSVRGYITTEEGAKYGFSRYLDVNYGAPEVSGTYEFYFDVFSKLVAYEKIAGPHDWAYGYLQWVRTISDMAGQVCVKMFNAAGETELLPISKKLYVLDEQDNENSWTQGQISNALSILGDADTSNDATVDTAIANFLAYSGVVRYKINSSSEIIKLELPLYYGKKPTKTNRLWCMIDIASTDTTVTNYPGRKYVANHQDYPVGVSTNRAIFGGVAAATAATTVWFVPMDKTDYSEYSLSSVTSFESTLGTSGAASSQRYMIFNTDYRSVFADVAILTSANQAGTANLQEQRMMYVRSVKKVVDPKTEEPCYEIEIINGSNNKVEKYLMEAETYLTGVQGVSNGHLSDGDGDGINDAIVHLGPGDGIYYAVENGYLVDAMVFYDADQMVYDTNVTNAEIQAGTAQKTIKGGIAGVEKLSYEPYTLSNPFASGGGSGSSKYQGNHEVNQSTPAHYFDAGNIKVFVGWVYDYQNGVVTVTNQNPAYGINPLLDEDDGVAWETNSASTVFSYPEMGRVQNFADVKRVSADSVIRPYTSYGSACSKIVFTKRVYSMESMCIINPN